MPTAAEHFSAIREHLNKPKTGANWRALKDHYLSGDATTSRRFEAEFKPVVLDTLEKTWPMELRTVGIYDKPHVHDYGRVMCVSFYGSGQASFGHQFGKNYKNTITKKLIKEMIPHWMPREGVTYRGLVLEHVDKLHAHLLEQMLATGKFDQLEFVRFPDVSPTFVRKDYSYVHEDLTDLANALIDQRGETLRSFGASFSGSSCKPRALYDPLVERIDELPNLSALQFSSKVFDHADAFPVVMNDPGFDHVDTLSFTEGLSAERARLLMGRAASLNLRRVGIGHKAIYGVGVGLEELVGAPNLANVEAWDIRDEARYDESWDTKDVARWRDHKAGVRRDELAFAVVDLLHHTSKQTRAAILDGDGALRPSTELRALRIGNVFTQDLFTLIDTAHEAWPNLECLVFEFDMNDHDLRDRWDTSPLLDRLRFLDWDDLFHPIKQHVAQYNVGKTRAAENLAAELDRILDGSMHRVLAFRHWHAIRDKIQNKPHASVIAKGLGLKGYSKLALHEILALCEAEIAERLGGEDALACDRSGGLVGVRYDRFEWTPSPLS